MGNAAVTVALPCAAAAATAALPRGAGMATGDIRVTMTGEAAGTAATATRTPGMESAVAIADATRIPGAMTTEGDTAEASEAAAVAAVTVACPRRAGMATGDIGVEVTMTWEAAGPAATATPIPGVVETGAAMVGGLEWVEGTVVGLEVVTLHAVEVLRVAVMVVADAMVVADDTPLPAAEALLPAA